MIQWWLSMLFFTGKPVRVNAASIFFLFFFSRIKLENEHRYNLLMSHIICVLQKKWENKLIPQCRGQFLVFLYFQNHLHSHLYYFVFFSKSRTLSKVIHYEDFMKTKNFSFCYFWTKYVICNLLHHHLIFGPPQSGRVQ